MAKAVNQIVEKKKLSTPPMLYKKTQQIIGEFSTLASTVSFISRGGSEANKLYKINGRLDWDKPLMLQTSDEFCRERR